MNIQENRDLVERFVTTMLEFSDWVEYWLSPRSGIVRAEGGHIAWAIANVLTPEEWRRDSEGKPAGVHVAMRNRGWVRVIRKEGRIFADVYLCTDSQLSKLKDFAREKRMIVTDEKSNRDFFNPASPDDHEDEDNF